MRVLHVVPTYYPAVRYGGPIRSVHGLCAALARRGHEVHVYTTNVDGSGISDVPTDRPVDLHGVKVHYFPVNWPRRLYRSALLQRKLAESIAGFDVVHLHSVFLWPTWAAARAAQRASVPYLVSPRGMLVGHVIRRKSRWIKTAWIQLIERRTLARAAAIHVTAQLEATELESLGLRLPPIRCIANGVEYPDAPLPRANGPYAALPLPYVLFLSRIEWKKGLDRLLEAWRLLPALHLVIAGVDQDGYQEVLQSLVSKYSLKDRVSFIGEISDEHKWSVYVDAMIFVLPSYSENFGNVVAEAMAMRCAVVVTPDVGIAAVVQAANAGVVTVNDPRELAKSLQQLSEDPALRHTMGLNGRIAVNQLFSWPAVAQSMEELYGDVRNQRRAITRL